MGFFKPFKADPAYLIIPGRSFSSNRNTGKSTTGLLGEDIAKTLAMSKGGTVNDNGDTVRLDEFNMGKLTNSLASELVN
jgi:hypothetical protein